MRVDPVTYEAEWLLNNFYGFNFGGLNDLTVDPVGDIWFTDSGMLYLEYSSTLSNERADFLWQTMPMASV